MEATILFADLCGFTSMSENMEPSKVAHMHNGFLSRMTDVIFKHEGTLDKFIGDCVMAFFGAPVSTEDHAEKAIACALDMRKALWEYNEQAEGAAELNFRVGINTGRIVAGDIGSTRRMEYTVLERSSTYPPDSSHPWRNPADSRGQKTYESARGKFKMNEIKDVQVKGISKPLPLRGGRMKRFL